MTPENNLAGVKAVIFDVFGTLASIGEKRRPYAKLLELLHEADRSPQTGDVARIMSNNVGLSGADHHDLHDARANKLCVFPELS